MDIVTQLTNDGKGHARWHTNGSDSARLRYAAEMRQAGLHVVPPKEGGSKRPHGSSWEQYQTRPPTEAELARFFRHTKYGLGFVTGTPHPTAPGLVVEVLDVDDQQTWIDFLTLAKSLPCQAPLTRVMNGWYEQTPKPGAHLAYWTPVRDGSKKLATVGGTTLIETRAADSYIITASSCGPVHPSGKPYTRVSGGPLTMATVTEEERAALFALAHVFSAAPEAEPHEDHTPSDHSGTRPGDLYAAHTSWREILEPHGWVLVYERDGTGFWRRPGKDHGVSATTNYANTDLLYVFSTSTDFANNRGYGKFSAYATLNHNGDFTRASAALRQLGYGTPNGNAYAVHEEEDDEDEEETDQELNARILKEERPVEDPWPCPEHLWRGPFATVANDVGRKNWEVWLAVLVALGARVNRNIDLSYHRRLYGMVYALLIKGTGMGKGMSTDLCRSLLPDDYRIADAVQSGPGLAPILADIERDSKGKVESVNAYLAALLIEEFTTLLKNAGIQHSTIIDVINSLFHRPWAWNVSRTDRPNGGGGNLVIPKPTLSILATTTQSLFKEYVSPQMIRLGFLNRFLVLPGDTTAWKFYDPDGAGRIIDSHTGLLDDITTRTFHYGKTVWECYTPDARERMVSWGERTFEPLMQSAELEAESVKRLHVYAHVIGCLYAYGERTTDITLDHVECAISAITTSLGFLQSLIAEEHDPEVPKFKAYEISLEQKILAKVREAGAAGIPRRKVIQNLAGKSATSADIYALITKMIQAGTIREVETPTEGAKRKTHKLYLPEHNPNRKKKET